MTANEARQPIPDFASAIVHGVRRIMSALGKVFLAVMIVLAAGLLAVATAVAGLFLALAALVLRFSGTRPNVRENGASVTLEAKRTARGWTVE